MLVIRRRPGESIVLPGGVEVQILEISANRVKVGVTAPPDVPVLRKETVVARSQNQAAAASTLPAGLADFALGLRARYR